ncbi:FAD/NAD(P)-binding domain-containing protein [Fistulina hepatica ATCC 64428]|uniref:FAD/NAD(P)-binding domain-containing protein n=1 Tax=Fistulina hepatica ATCC 64428 TaxID=1128425 RepID=A0A0D7AEP1_9AGAR|nr:FAD/NAD(P)-binding domain-containing protein [Fistulina hepatica ATCC 64428]
MLARFSKPTALTGSLALLSFLPAVQAQSSSSYTDSNTGITFQAYTDADTGIIVGIAVPETIDKSFIGLIVAPLTDGEGWGGVSFAGDMADSLLLVTWPDNDEVMYSFRETSTYVTPPVYNGSVSLSVIESGTFVNDTHISLTYVCNDCIVDGLTFTATDTTAVMGYAVSSTNPTDVSDSATDLSYHSEGYGEFGMLLSKAASSKYDTWAAMASNSTTTTNSSSSIGSTAVSATASATASATTSTSAEPTATYTSTYDAIIVGGGPAGIIVAERLAEQGDNVLLIERGAASSYSSGGNMTMPWNDTATVFDVPSMAYELSTLDDTSFYCTDTASEAGCILGGSSTVNMLMFVRPQPAYFDDYWPTSWKWDNVSASAEALYDRNPGTDLPSSDGKRYDQSVYKIVSTLLGDNNWTEVDAISDPSAKYMAYAHPPWNILDSERAGPVATYLPLAQQLDNFELMLETKVISAVRTGSYITGVEVERNNTRTLININDNGKVILAAGTLSTPRLLFNSGIGPSDQISIVQSGSTGVTLPDESEWIDLPVGEHLMDHPIFTLTLNANFSAYDFATLDTDFANKTNTELYNTEGAGIIAQGGQRLNFWSRLNGTDGHIRYFQGTVGPTANDTFTIKVYLTHGLTSSGTLGIQSDGSTVFTVDPWMNTDADKAAAAEFIDELVGYIEAQSEISFSSLMTNTTGAYIIKTYITGDHFVGTARMGESNDGTAVVDTNTKVFGTDNLFVVDASMHPNLPTGNTQATVMVAAEKAAEKLIAYTVTTNSTSSASGSAAVSASASATATVTIARATFASSATASSTVAAASSSSSSSGAICRLVSKRSSESM